MMDSQENAPVISPSEETVDNEVKKEEVAAQPAETPVAQTASPVETEEVQPQKVYETKAEILERVREIAHTDESPQKEEIDYLKTAFYKLHIAEREAKIKAFVDAGGDPEQYQISPDEQEEAFKAEMGIIKEKRAKIFKEQEAEKQENLTKKLAIIDKIKAMITTPEEANKSYQEFKALQQQWREIKNVPAEKANELWRNYQLYVEQFYDMLRLNSIARDEDFKKNLEAKTRLCEIAENLANEDDIISAFHQLQKLHQEYRELGPVAKEQREEIWNRFKTASTVINKRHQQHFEGIRAKEEENLARKTELCEKVEAIAAEENKGSGDWEKHTKQIIELQTEWKTIGFAPQKMNVKIFERFRAACDDFFGRKAEYFKGLKETFKENAEKKRALIEKAKALQDSTEWKSTSDKLIALQKEWKTIGMVPKKLGDQLWEEFLGACNKFFEARKAAGAGQHSDEYDNLAKKREVIEKDIIDEIFVRFPKGSSTYLPLMFAYHCGMRLGEAFAITWDNVNFADRTVTINKQLQWDLEKKFWYLTPPKYNSSRTIDIDETIVELLKEMQEKQIRAKEYYADEYSLIYYDEELGINESTGNVIDFVNVYENGGFIQPRTIQHTSQVIHKFYPAFTFHSLRHTHCTRLLEAGLPIKYVQERLGHKNISVTMDIYNHLTQSQAELSKRALEDVFK